ncbi:HprK-related kinase B [Thiomicrospira microaerophila]|uniref:HprK-related kinase B n=1 Tax=Thiomicrospira microaerophila TaxID=406020 RepID=UPI000698672E|nr:HprK-related kinase B [Thiomicrospira microaerophila]
MTAIIQTLNALCQKASMQPGLVVTIDHWSLFVESNSAPLLNYLAEYFAGLAEFHHTPPLGVPSITAIEIEQATELDAIYHLPFSDWQREPGKTGRKEAVYDFTNDTGQPQRLVHKIKTGLVLWQSAQRLACLGALNQHPNQVINFILSQYLNHWQNQDWLLGHCAALQLNDQRGIAIAGVSGGGKSTLMLKLLEDAQAFISNDRILIQANQQQVMMRGIPKQPRINPGTIIHNPKLHRLIDDHQPYLALAEAELRALEEKYDAPVCQLYKGVNYQPSARLDQLYLLNWQVNSTEPTRIARVNLAQRPELLAGVMKSAGVFYQHRDQTFQTNGQTPDPLAYQTLLAQTSVFEITGKLDFNLAKEAIMNNTLNI